MIYCHGRFCFIHIPRTGGNSITKALAISCIGNHDVLIATGPKILGPWKRHIPAFTLQKVIKDWNKIYKFAIYRPKEEIIKSEQALFNRDIADGKHEDIYTDKDYKNLLLGNTKSFLANMIEDPWEFWATENGNDLGVDKIHFNELEIKWPEVCERCKIDYVPLEHLNKGLYL